MTEKFADIELDVEDKVVCGKWIAAHVKMCGRDKYLVATTDNLPIATAFTYEGAKVIAAGLNIADETERVFAEVDRGSKGVPSRAFDCLEKQGYDKDKIKTDVDQMMADGKSCDDIAKYLFENEARYRKHDDNGKGAW